jgi:single-strand DNA-binding protein
MNFNRVILIGRLTRDPEIRTTSDGITVAKFGVAVNRYSKSSEDQADFFDVVAWRQQADFVANYVGKGRLVLIEGKLQTRSWTAQDGTKRKAVEIVADRVQPLERARDFAGEGEGEPESPAAQTGAPAKSAAAAAAPQTDEFNDIPEDFDTDEDPFAQM